MYGTVMTHPPYHKSVKVQAPGVLWLRIGGLLVLVIASVLALTSFLNYSNYRKTLVELNLTRHLVLVKDLRQAVESGLNIGLRPAENETLLPLLRQVAHRHGGISYIVLLDDMGGILGVGKYPMLAATNWKELLLATPVDQYWQSGDRGAAQLGVVFANSFNVKIGAVVIGYDMAGLELASNAMLWKLIQDTVMVLILMASITLVAVYYLTRQFTRDLKMVGDNIAATLDPELPAPLARDVFGSGVAEEINQFSLLMHHVGVKLSQLEAGVALAGPDAGKLEAEK